MTIEVCHGFFYADAITMPLEEFQPGSPTTLVSVLTILLNSDWISFVAKLWNFARKFLTARAHEGMYEALEYETTLELLDPKGRKAVFHKREKVRFLQDNIIAYQDKAWGDGQIFADYECSPGVAVDRYQQGQAYQVLISLRGVRHRGDVDEFHINRTIKKGFLIKLGFWQADIDHPMQKVDLHFVFPRSRPPESVKLIERQANRTTILGPEHILKLPDGRTQVSWSTNKPRLFESYTIQWIW